MIYNLTEYPGHTISATAGSVIPAERFVDAAIQAGTSASNVFGISQYDAAATGDPIAINMDGILKVAAGAAVSVGAFVQSDSTGRAITRIGSAHPVGIAYTAATTSDETILIKIPV